MTTRMTLIQAPTLLNHTNEDEHVNWSWLGACFGAVAKDGYGICYRFAGNHSICIHITSYKSAQNTVSGTFENILEDKYCLPFFRIRIVFNNI